jgi:peptidyl-prolyl cis-trans isomerase C
MKNSKIYHARHILVQHQNEAEDIIKLIKSENDFIKMAQKYSICSSAPLGGDLGALRIGKADEEFEQAASELKPGEFTKVPVRTRFGYHIIYKPVKS